MILCLIRMPEGALFNLKIAKKNKKIINKSRMNKILEFPYSIYDLIKMNFNAN